LLRVLAVVLAPFAAGYLVGRAVPYQELIAFEPGIASVLMTAMLFGVIRNISRIILYMRLRRA